MFRIKRTCAVITTMQFFITITILFCIFTYNSSASALRRDSVLLIPRYDVIKASIDYIGMTDLLTTINSLYLNGYYGLMGKYVDEYFKKYTPVKEIYYFKAITHIHTKNYEEALHNLCIALAMEPEYSRALNAIGYVYALRGQWQQALSHFLLAHRANMYNPFISYNLALLYYCNLHYILATTWAYKAINDKPNFARAYDVYACSLYQQQKYEEAIQYWDKAVELGLNELRLRLNKAYSYFILGKYQECIKECSEILKINKQHFDAITLLAYAQYMNHDYDAAIMTCNRALKIKKQNIIVSIIMALGVAKKNPLAGEEMLIATLGKVDQVEEVGKKILNNYQFTISDPPLDFMLY